MAGPVPACCDPSTPPGSSFPDLSEGFLDLTISYELYGSFVESTYSSIPWGFVRLQWINGFMGGANSFTGAVVQ